MKNRFGFILIKPQLGENIGACARALKNFNFHKLLLVDPKPTFPNDKIIATSVGAKNIIKSGDLDKEARPLDKGLYDGAVDTVGGNILANILSHVKPNGIVAACGNASSIKLNTTVMPFIIRGVKLWGIDSVSVSIKRREFLWDEVSKLVDFDLLDKSIKEISLEQLLVEYPKMLEGKTSGRYIINVNK